MNQRGRKPGAALAVIPRVDGTPERLKPPDSLTSAEQEAFINVVSGTVRGHFAASDMPLLAAYARAITLDAHAAQMLREQGYVLNGKPNPWLVVKQTAHREMINLSLRLRLSPQGRVQVVNKPTERQSWYERQALEHQDDDDKAG
jgi:phage terminase small subunit